MRRRVKITILLVLMVVSASAALLSISWLLGTTDGASWLISAISWRSNGAVKVAGVEGRLLDRLRLTGVRIDLKGSGAEVDSLELRWRPLMLLGGRVSIRDLAARGVRIREKAIREKKPVDLAWPRVHRVMRFLSARVRRLDVKELTYIPAEGGHWEIISLTGKVRWGHNIVSLVDFTLSTPHARLSGKAAAGFGRPFLSTDLQCELLKVMAGMERCSLTARLFPGSGDEQVAGKITMTGKGAKRGPVELSAHAALTRRSIKLGDIVLTESGRRGRVTGDGEAEFGPGGPRMRLSLKANSLDLGKETGIVSDLSGGINVAGSPDRYSGSFSLANRGKAWRNAALSGSFGGNREGVKMTPLRGSVLDGSVKGEMDIRWRDGLLVSGSLNGDGLDPERISPQWKGIVNFALSGSLTRAEKGATRWEVDARLRESRLHGRTLSGEAVAAYSGGILDIDRLFLRGNGFDLKASGDPERRLSLDARISDLSMLLPGCSGRLSGDGWLRWRKGRPSGEVTIRGNALAMEGVRISALDLSAILREGDGYPARLKGVLRGAGWRGLRADGATLLAEGTLDRHTVSASLRSDGAQMAASFSAGYDKGLWQGDIVRLSGSDGIGPWRLAAPAGFSVGAKGFSVSGLEILGGEGERLAISGRFNRVPWRGTAESEWTALRLARLSRWLEGSDISGSSSGKVTIAVLDGERLDARGSAMAKGSITLGGRKIAVDKAQLTLTGDGKGTRLGLDLRLAGGGAVAGSVSSSLPLRMGEPLRGRMALNWNAIDTALVGKMLPKGISLEGIVSGHADGELLPEWRVALHGEARLLGGKLHWRDGEGEIGVGVRSAGATWDWRDDRLNGKAEITLTEHGEARGSFSLPLLSRIPPHIDPKGEVTATLTARVGEKGILTALFPGMVRESSGSLTADLQLSGRWEEPEVGGTVRLEKAGAYLPSAGIRLKDVELSGRLEKGLIRIESFKGSSGPGSIAGSGVIRFKGREVTGFQGMVKGERFAAVHFPEFRLQCSPDLTFEGTPKRLSVRGEVRIPEMEINGPPSGKVIEPSGDVVLEGSAPPAPKGSPVELDVKVRVMLGDKVRVNAEGIDALLAGSVDLTMTGLDRIYSRGEIRVVKGRYRTYGVNLDIERGRLFYAGGQITSPTLDVLALRTVGDVRAGVTVAGAIQSPVIKLYSVPSMSDADVLAYVILGHPLGSSNGSQSSLLIQAAGALLSSNQAQDIQEQIRSRLGLSTLEIGSGKEPTTSGTMGYKVIPSAPPGTAAPATTASETILTVGKYLTPKLYFSYGRSIFTGANLFRLRYDIFKQWQIETQSGTESGADIYYSIEFD